MRKRLLLILSSALAAFSPHQEAQAQFAVWKDGQAVYIDYTVVPDFFEMKAAESSVKSSQTVDRSKVGGTIANESEAIDLGLSVKWAPWNIGASKPSGYGEYFAWGEITPKTDENDNYGSYDWDAYRLGDEIGDDKIMYKYNKADGKKKLDPSDDAATANWGGKWRMPTQKEFAELKEKCEWTWKENYKESGHNGYVIKSKDGNAAGELFLPAAGSRDRSTFSRIGESGNYWSSGLRDSDNAFDLTFYKAYECDPGDWVPRLNGFSVRAVCPK